MLAMNRRDLLRSVAYGATASLVAGGRNLIAQESSSVRRYRYIHLDVFTGSIVNAQGALVGRPSRIHVRISSAGGEITQVKVGGVSVVLGEGTASV
jgi:hypothetical protein